MASILSDELLRQLIAVGQVDVMVGLPSFNQAPTIGDVTRKVHLAFAGRLTRERTLLVNADGGSTDGTAEAVRTASLKEDESVIATQALRTIHRISAPYHGVCGKGSALRSLLTAADLVQARAIVILDPEVTSLTPEWVAALAEPVLRQRLDFVAPLYARHPADGPLVTQLARPFVQSVYGRRLREPLGGEFACSPRFAAHLLATLPWDDEWLQDGVDPWVATTALSGEFSCGQAPLGPRTATPALRPGLSEVIQQVVGTLFACLERHAPCWRSRSGITDVPLLGPVPAAAGPTGALDLDDMAASFRAGALDLAPLHEEILPGPLAVALRGAAQAGNGPDIPDAMWAETVFAFACADHEQRMPRGHLLQALVPLYLGRAASFLGRHARTPAADIEHALDELCTAFAFAKPLLAERWTPESGR